MACSQILWSVSLPWRFFFFSNAITSLIIAGVLLIVDEIGLILKMPVKKKGGKSKYVNTVLIFDSNN